MPRRSGESESWIQTSGVAEGQPRDQVRQSCRPRRRVQPRDSQGIGRDGVIDPGIRRSEGSDLGVGHVEAMGRVRVMGPGVGRVKVMGRVRVVDLGIKCVDAMGRVRVADPGARRNDGSGKSESQVQASDVPRRLGVLSP